MYTIKKNVPIPPIGLGKQIKKGYKCKYPFALMNPGDSFFVKCSHEQQLFSSLRKSDLVAQGIRSAFRTFQKNNKLFKQASCKLTIRTVKRGIRVWLVN